jgi:hypothetical protein
MNPFRSIGIRAFAVFGMLAAVGCASSQEKAGFTRLVPIREPARSVSHPPQTLTIPPSLAVPVLLQANNSTLRPDRAKLFRAQKDWA